MTTKGKFLSSVLTMCLSFMYYSGVSQCQTLVWGDDFNGSSVDQSKWAFDIGDGCPSLCGWGNAEEQYYRAENATVQNGNLIITTNLQNFGGKSYTSAKLTTLGKFTTRYGRIEASIKLPSAGGIWPAFWLLPENGSWPSTGEIDIMEASHSNPSGAGGTVHYDNGGHQFNGREYNAGLDLSLGFHEYAIEWEPDEIRWYVDDQLFHTVTPANTVDPWPFDDGDWFIILNVAVGGPGTPYTGNISPTPGDYPTQMEVDYVHVFSGTFNTQLNGDNSVYVGETGKTYSISPIPGASYSWNVPPGASISSGQGTNSILVDWGNTGGELTVDVTVSGCGTNEYKMSVAVEEPRTLDFIFEDFEGNRNVSYVSTTTGTLSQSVSNPAPSSINNSTSVGKYDRDPSETYDVMFMSTDYIGNGLEFISGKRAFFLDMYSSAPVGTEILLQLEDGALSGGTWPAGRHSRYMATTTAQNNWQELEFEFLDRPDAAVGAFDVDQIAILIDPNTNTAHTTYFDNLVSMTAPDPTVLEEVVIADYNGTNQLTEIFSDGVYTANVSNPAPDAINNSSAVASYARNAGSPYDVVSFVTGAIENTKSFKDGNNIFYLDVYTAAPSGTEITISLENAATSENDYPAGRNSQYAGVVEQSNAWHTIAFIHASSPDAGTSDLGVDEVSILFDPNSNSSDTYYIDNFRYGVTAYPASYVFNETIQNYNGTDHLVFDAGSTGTYTTNVSNPDPNSVNGSSLVGKYDRNITEDYDVLFFDTNFITDASAYSSEEKRFAMDIYTSAPIGTIISWQLEASSTATSSNYPAGRHSIYQAAVKEQNSWHTVEFILTATPDLIVSDNQVDNVVFLFNPAVPSNYTFYIDNLRSLVKETEQPVLTSILVTPANPTIDQGESQQFNAQGLDQNGQPVSASFTWSTTGGSIDQNGQYSGTANGNFTVTATSGSIDGSTSITVDEVVTDLPSPWASQDIGNVGVSGTASHASGTFTLNASGADIWGTADEFHYIHQDLSGDGEIIARVTDLTNTDGWAKSGVMIRDGLDANAKHAMMVVTPGNGTGFQYRASTGGGSTHSGSTGNIPQWVRLIRSGNTFTGYKSSNGNSWIQVGSAIIAMGSAVKVGLLATSHNDGTTTTATFTNVSLSGSDPNEPPIVNITAPADNSGFTAPASITINADASDSDGTVDQVQFFNGGNLLGTDTTSPYSFSWNNVSAGNYNLTVVATDNDQATTTSSDIDITVNDAPSGFPVPGKIEAEDFAAQNGIQTEGTSDTGGGTNVGWIDAGDWLDYPVTISAAGDFEVNFRVASLSGGGVMELRLGMSTLASVSISATGGWQNWVTLSDEVTLPVGNLTLRLYAVSGGFNINWFEFTEASTPPSGCAFEAATGDYTADVVSDGTGTEITFIPSVAGVGDPTCILYYGTSATSTLPGYSVTPDQPYQINGTQSQTIYFYYTYSLPQGGENNTGSNRHSFVVGNCDAGARTAVDSKPVKENNASGWSVYPNPASDHLHINGLVAKSRYTIYDVSGKVMMTGLLDPDHGLGIIDISQLKAGSYVLTTFNTGQSLRFIRE